MLRRFPQGARPRAQQGPAGPHRSAPSTSSTPSSLSQGRRACRSPPARSRTHREGAGIDDRHRRPPDHEEGLDQRPGGPLVPRLRRLRHPARRPAADARARHGAREHRVHLRHRLLEPLPVLHEHLRDALDPRPRPGDRHRRRRRPPRPRRVGHHRRRRRPVDRRQPPDPRPAPQRQPHDPAVQQPDLRADQGPVLAHLRDRQGHQVDADRIDRPAVQPARRGPRRRGQLRGPHPRPRPQAHDGDVHARPTTTAAPRSSRSTRTATSSTTASSTTSRRSRLATR